MIKRLSVLIIFVLIPFALVSCQGEETKEQPFPIKKAPPAPKPSAAEDAAGAKQRQAPVASVKRNPFLSYLVEKGVRQVKRIKGPLECCDISLFRLMAVISGIDEPMAMVQAPDNKKYIVKSGDRIGLKEGKIIRIDIDSITVREKERDEEGKVISTNEVVLTLPKQKQRRGAG